MNEIMRIEARPTLAELLDYPVHPMAARFPMWPQDRLIELAADIEANGLNIPLVIWRKDPMLLDGRNRLAACAIAEVEPDVEFYDGEDPRALIISRNIQTREMSASQKAMLLAVEFPEGGKGGRGKKSETANLLVSSGFSRQLLDQARQINRWASDQVDGVIAGSPTFNAALKIAEENRQAASSRDARLKRLQDGAPDLARQVIEQTLTLDEAEAAWRERQRAVRSAVDAGRDALVQIDRLPSLVAAVLRASSLERIAIEPQSVANAERALDDLRKMLIDQGEDDVAPSR